MIIIDSVMTSTKEIEAVRELLSRFYGSGEIYDSRQPLGGSKPSVQLSATKKYQAREVRELLERTIVKV